MRFVIQAVLGPIVLAAATHAAQDLKAVMSSMTTSGKEMRLVYVKGGSPVAFNTASNAGVYVVSSTDGAIRKVYPSGTGVSDVRAPNLTYDGSKIVLYDYARGQVPVLNYDGTTIRTISLGSGYDMYDYWYNATTGKDYIVVSNQSVIEAINIAVPTEKVVITNKLTDINVSDGGLQISDDGKKMALVRSPSNGAESVGILTGALAGSGDGTFVPTNNGCWPQMRGGTPIMLSQNDGDHTGMPNHWGPQLFNENGSKAQFIATSDTLQKWVNQDAANRRVSNCSNGEEIMATDGHRWTRDRNYFSFYCNGSAMNPILWRTTDNKWIYIEEVHTCTFVGDMDMVLVTASGVEGAASHGRVASRPDLSSRSVYSIDGRRINPRTSSIRGVVIRTVAGAGVQATRLAVVQ